MVAEAAARAIAARGEFSLVLTGGSVAKGVYPLLRRLATDWSAWRFYWGDERCLPVDHPDRNSRVAGELWLDHVPVNADRVHVPPAELGAEAAARRYDPLLRDQPAFDLVLLGLGEDGHVASLFPGHDWGETEVAPAVIAVHDAAKPPPERISLSAWRLGLADTVLVIATGPAKAAAVAAWRRGEPLPARAITPVGGLDVWVDRACLGEHNLS